ncbi:MAG: OsmC family protein [Caldilineaceae bacterium]|nr:OsmC family protein [Caldilineaceae bacterium]MCB0127388.1 OsmC family protein [Caldilineaceae bacterium]
MAKLDSYMQYKATVLAQRREQFSANPEASLVHLQATSHVAGNTGVRPVKMGDYIIISDSAPGLAGNSLGPSSPEMLLGALASCLIHTYLLQATLLEIPLDHVEVTIFGGLDMAPVVGLPQKGPIKLEALSYKPVVTSDAPAETIERLHAAVEESCAVLNTLRSPMTVERQA